MKWIQRMLAVAVLVLGSTLAAVAADLGAVQVHVAGEWAMGDTDGNAYLAGDEDRDYSHRLASLTFSASPMDRLYVGVQAFLGSGGGEAAIEPEIDFAFAQWTFSDAVKLRAGVSRHPFGIYSETLETGTARSFFSLPQSIYGPGEFVSENYQGLGLTGFRPLGGNWEMSYDLYGGAVGFDSIEAVNPFLIGGNRAGEEREELEDVLGGRLLFADSRSGLRLGVSAYSGLPAEGEFDRLEVIGLQGEWSRGPWEVRSEYARATGGDDDVAAQSAYVEVARRLGDHWQAGLRWDRAYRDPEALELEETLEKHREIAATLNYWFTDGFVIKLSFHDVEGNLFAVPRIEEGEHLDIDEVQGGTRLIQLGAQFSF